VPIPGFQTIMLPILRLTGDGAEHTLVAAVQAAADEFLLTAEEWAQLLPHANHPDEAIFGLFQPSAIT
jgi:restriction system protein